jgi:sialidase-1
MREIKVGETGIVFRHPNAHVSSVHAYFPSMVSLGAGELLASVVLGEAFEATNLSAHLFRSTDHGETWVREGELCPAPEYGVFSNAARLTLTPTGELVAFIMRHDRTDHPNEGLTNVDTLGFVATELLLRRSSDKGKTWGAIQTIETPLVGPSFELCSPITILSDGRWLLPTSTWQGWSGDCPNGIRMIALESRDAGVS